MERLRCCGISAGSNPVIPVHGGCGRVDDCSSLCASDAIPSMPTREKTRVEALLGFPDGEVRVRVLPCLTGHVVE